MEWERIELESGHTFQMRSAHDVFRKLYRERRRFMNAGSGRAEQCDALINFAITAWHLADWVWKQHKEAVKSTIGVQTEPDFKNYVRKKCRELAVCDIIANAAKHGGRADSHAYRPDVETILVAGPIEEDGSQVEIAAAMVDRKWSLKIRVDGTTMSASYMVYHASLFWHRFLLSIAVRRD